MCVCRGDSYDRIRVCQIKASLCMLQLHSNPFNDDRFTFQIKIIQFIIIKNNNNNVAISLF